MQSPDGPTASLAAGARRVHRLRTSVGVWCRVRDIPRRRTECGNIPVLSLRNKKTAAKWSWIVWWTGSCLLSWLWWFCYYCICEYLSDMSDIVSVNDSFVTIRDCSLDYAHENSHELPASSLLVTRKEIMIAFDRLLSCFAHLTYNYYFIIIALCRHDIPFLYGSGTAPGRIQNGTSIKFQDQHLSPFWETRLIFGRK